MLKWALIFLVIALIAGYAGESKGAGDQGDHQEDQGPLQHLPAPRLRLCKVNASLAPPVPCWAWAFHRPAL